MNRGTAVTKTKLAGPFDEEVVVYHSDGLLWASIAQWCSVLKTPYFMPDYLVKAAESNSSLMKGGPFTTTVEGTKVYRWPPIAAAIDSWHRSWMVTVAKGEHAALPLNKRKESERFALNVARLKQWGYELQERELQSVMTSKMTPNQSATGLAEVNQAIQAIQSLAQVTRTALETHGEALDEHNERIIDIEKSDPLRRDSNAFVTVKQRCLERALSLAFVVEGRMNLSQACGQYLQKAGSCKGPVSKERLDGSSLIVEVATWRRIDIDSAIEHYLPDFAMPRMRKERD